MSGIYKNIEDYNPNKERKVLIANKERKVLIVFDDMIADVINNKKLNPIVTELFITGRKIDISTVYYSIIL